MSSTVGARPTGALGVPGGYARPASRQRLVGWYTPNPITRMRTSTSRPPRGAVVIGNGNVEMECPVLAP